VIFPDNNGLFYIFVNPFQAFVTNIVACILIVQAKDFRAVIAALFRTAVP
jgi:hypothetical protein